MNTDYEKQVIGKLINYYRKKMNIKNSALITLSNGEKICSTKTLIKLEHGIPVKDQYYDSLAMKIHLFFSLEESDLKQMENCRKALYNCLYHFSKSDMMRLLSHLNLLFAKYDRIIYFRELFALYRDILNYHLYDQSPCSSHIEFYVLTKDFFLEKDKKLILYFLYQICNLYPTLNRTSIQSECLTFEKDGLFLGNVLVSIYQHNTSFIALNKTEEILTSIYKNATSYQKITVYNMIAMIQLNMNDPYAAHESIQKIGKLVKDNDFPDQLLVKLHMRASITSYVMKEYDETVNNFLICYQIHPQRLNYNYLLLFNALEKTNQLSLLKKTINEKKYPHQNIYIQKIFYYYHIKHSSSYNTTQKHQMLCDLIVQDLADIVKFSDLYKKILVEELLNHVAVLRNYKSLYIFLKKTQN